MNIGKIWDKAGIYILTAIALVLFSTLTSKMISASNLMNILTQSSMVAIAAAGMTFAITSGGFDLSVGSTLSIATCILGVTIPTIGLWPAILITLIVGVILGTFNGIIITKFKIQTFVATLATMVIYRGVAFLFTQGRDATLMSNLDIKVFSSGRLFGIPLPIIFMVVVYLVAFVIYKYTPYGLYTRAVGSNEPASRISGIKVDRTIIITFILTATTAVFAGIIQTSQLLTGSGRLGKGFELEVITATILGGTSLAGGKGNIWGSLCAAILLGIVRNGLNLLGVGESYQQLITGAILIFALAISGFRLIFKKKAVA